MRNRYRTSLPLKMAALIFVVFCLITIVKQQFDFNKLKDQQAQIEQQIISYTERIEELKQEIDRPYDEAYIKKYAREKLNYRMPEEILFYNDLMK